MDKSLMVEINAHSIIYIHPFEGNIIRINRKGKFFFMVYGYTFTHSPRLNGMELPYIGDIDGRPCYMVPEIRATIPIEDDIFFRIVNEKFPEFTEEAKLNLRKQANDMDTNMEFVIMPISGEEKVRLTNQHLREFISRTSTSETHPLAIGERIINVIDVDENDSIARFGFGEYDALINKTVKRIENKKDDE